MQFGHYCFTMSENYEPEKRPLGWKVGNVNFKAHPPPPSNSDNMKAQKCMICNQ